MKVRCAGLVLILVLIIQSTSLMAQSKTKGYSNWALKGEFKPFVEVMYGVGQPKHINFTDDFAKYGLIEARIGYTEIIKFRKSVYSLDDRFVFGDFLSSDASFLEDKEGRVKSEIYRFGFGNRLGYGYQLGGITLMPYNQNQFVWTKLTSTRPEDMLPENIQILDRYEGSYRFGISSAAGVKLDLYKTLSVMGAYEFAVVYPRVIFWPWLGSYMIMQTGINMVSVFSEDIVKSSPVFGPLMYFLLKNGIAYAFYTGLQEKMNWPFTSETPMTMESFKIGASLTF